MRCPLCLAEKCPVPVYAAPDPRYAAGRYRKQRVFDAALKEFSTWGYNAVGIRAIMQRCGVTLPQLYYYFGSKQRLFQALLRDVLGEELESLQDAQRSAPGSARDRLRSLLRSVFKRVHDNPRKPRLLIQTLCGPSSRGLERFVAKQGQDRLSAYHRAFSWALKDRLHSGVSRRLTAELTAVLDQHVLLAVRSKSRRLLLTPASADRLVSDFLKLLR